MRISTVTCVLGALLCHKGVVAFLPCHSKAKAVSCRHGAQGNADAVMVTTVPEETCTDDNDPEPCLWAELTARFQGDFDNYNQVVSDRKAGMLPREGGGHEHIHCSLVPVAENARLAAFYFDGDPTAIFRFRYYQLVHNHGDNTVDTVLYTIDPALEGQLRQSAANPLAWKAMFEAENGHDRVTLLQDCDVRWSWSLDPVQHAYAVAHHENKTNKQNDPGMHAVMVHGEAVVESTIMPGFQILIRDQLSLWSDELWIHDRGFDPKTMKFIYGNQKEIPYRLERVADMIMSEGESTTTTTERHVVNQDLSWTLGPEERTEQEYQAKLAKVGGPSRPQRR